MKKTILLSIILLSVMATSAKSPEPLWGVDDCIRYAVDNNLELKKQFINELNAKDELTVRSLSFLPSISANSSITGNFGRSIDPETNTYQSVSNMGNNYGISGSMSIFDGLRVLNGFKIAKASKLRQEFQTKQVENQVALTTMSAYYRAIFAHGAYKIATQELGESRKLYQKKKVEHEVGLANISDLAQLESRVSQGEYNLTNLEGIYRKAVVELKNQINFPLNSSLQIDTMSRVEYITEQSNEDFEAVVAIAETVLPEFEIMSAQERIAKLNLSSARANLFPSLSLSGGISTGYSQSLGGEGGHPSYASQMKNKMGEYVGVSLNIPIFGALSRQKNIKRQKNEFERIKIESMEQNKEIQKFIYEAIIDLESNEKQCTQSVANVNANTLSYNSTEAKFNEGLSSVVDVQTVQTNLSRAKMDYLKAFLNYKMQRRIVDYYKGISLIR